MKKFLLFGFLLINFIACSKDSGNNEPKQATLSVIVIDHQPPPLANHYWGIRLSFNPAVTLTGSVKVEYDVYNLGAFGEHYSYKIPIDLNNENAFTYNTKVGSQLQGPEIKNLKVDSLIITEGNYYVTIK